MTSVQESKRGAKRCEHPDVRADRSEAHRTAIACFKCGRLFGWLSPEEVFVAFNPSYLRRAGDG
jgi:hypothetical protein